MHLLKHVLANSILPGEKTSIAPFVFDLNSVGCTVLSGSALERFGWFQGLAATVFSLSCTISEVVSMSAFFFRPAPKGGLSRERDRGCKKGQET